MEADIWAEGMTVLVKIVAEILQRRRQGLGVEITYLGRSAVCKELACKARCIASGPARHENPHDAAHMGVPVPDLVKLLALVVSVEDL